MLTGGHHHTLPLDPAVRLCFHKEALWTFCLCLLHYASSGKSILCVDQHQVNSDCTRFTTVAPKKITATLDISSLQIQMHQSIQQFDRMFFRLKGAKASSQACNVGRLNEQIGATFWRQDYIDDSEHHLDAHCHAHATNGSIFKGW